MNKRNTVTLKGHIQDIGFEYELKTEKQHKEALKDLKAFSKQIDKAITKDSSLIKKINNYKLKTGELKKQTKELEKQIKYTRDKCIIDNFKKLIRQEIKNYKDWEIEELITQEILNTNRYGGSLRRLIATEIKEQLKNIKVI